MPLCHVPQNLQALNPAHPTHKPCTLLVMQASRQCPRRPCRTCRAMSGCLSSNPKPYKPFLKPQTLLRTQASRQCPRRRCQTCRAMSGCSPAPPGRAAGAAARRTAWPAQRPTSRPSTTATACARALPARLVFQAGMCETCNSDIQNEKRSFFPLPKKKMTQNAEKLHAFEWCADMLLR